MNNKLAFLCLALILFLPRVCFADRVIRTGLSGGAVNLYISVHNPSEVDQSVTAKVEGINGCTIIAGLNSASGLDCAGLFKPVCLSKPSFSSLPIGLSLTYEYVLLCPVSPDPRKGFMITITAEGDEGYITAHGASWHIWGAGHNIPINGGRPF